MMYDVVVVGLGPAGASFCRLLSDKFKVLALDKKHQQGDDGFHKPCGGLLATDCQRSFIRQNLNLPNTILANPQIFSVKTYDIQTKLVRNYQRTYVNINRHQFDLWMKDLIPAHIEIRHNTLCTKICQHDGHYLVTFVEQGIEYQVTCRFIVGADGANSMVRRTFYPNHHIRKYIAIQQWFLEKHSQPFYSCIFDNSITNCYAWSISKDNYFIFGGAFEMNQPNQYFALLKQRMTDFGFCFGDVLKTEKCVVLCPEHFKDFCCGKDNVLLIGEAAGFISASSLEGLSYALDSAEILSKLMNDSSEHVNQRYHRKTLLLRLKLYGKIIKNKVLTQPLLRKWIMQSKLFHIKLSG